MDSRIPAFPQPQTGERRAGKMAQHIWERASSMAADRSQSETGRTVRTYAYASGFIGVVFLVLLGASLLFVVHTVATACSGLARLVLRPFHARPSPPR